MWCNVYVCDFLTTENLYFRLADYRLHIYNQVSSFHHAYSFCDCWSYEWSETNSGDEMNMMQIIDSHIII